jgi:ribosome-binding factor A
VNEEETKRSFRILQENAGFIRHELAQVMRMRTVPAITFRMDGSMVYGAKMDELFKKITYSTPAEEVELDDEN